MTLTVGPQKSHPTGVRGLKFWTCTTAGARAWSHPTGVRGLKSTVQEDGTSSRMVAPHWGAWIEIPRKTRKTATTGKSHPTGVRGLKYPVGGRTRRKQVAPHWGAWIEIDAGYEHGLGFGVAPHWGAWIEITELPKEEIQIDESHPTGVRGLKWPRLSRPRPTWLVVPHWGVWIEIE